MSTIEVLNSIDKSKIKWIKNIKRDKGLELAYFDEYENNEFNLHWPKSKAGNANAVKSGDYIILYQNYLNKGVIITHLVEVVDLKSFIDDKNANNFQTARKVKIIYRTEKARNDKRFKFDFRNVSQGQAFNLSLLNKDLSDNAIKDTFLELFKNVELSKFQIFSNAENEYIFQIPRNKLYPQSQIINSKSKTITFVGKNGCGKSAILESIFSSAISDTKYKYICFSSGQNELFSRIFGKIKYLNKDNYLEKEEVGIDIFDTKINAFYFNPRWVRILVFFAYVFYPKGKTANLINSRFNNLILESVVVKLGLDFKMDWDSTFKIKREKEKEELGEFSEYLHSTLFTTIDAFVNYCIEPEPEYQKPIKQTTIEVSPEIALQVYKEKDIDKALNCFTYGEEFFDLTKTKLQFNNLELRDLSDGEFQLLSVYALVDLFDSPDTVFLLDEIDSHLYYDNISKVWNTLNQIESFAFVTTHIVDSIVLNKIENLKLVDEGKINSEGKLYELIERLNSLTDGEYKKKKIATQVEYIALVEDKTDWIIFTELAKKKLGEGFKSEVIEKVRIVKCPSGYDKVGDDFGESKKYWVKEFSKSSDDIKTKNIFFICDRDVLPIGNMIALNSPQATGDPKSLITIIGEPKKNIYPFKGDKKPHLLSWRRREIENYLFTYEVLKTFNLQDSIRQKFGDSGYPIEGQKMDGNEIIRDTDYKPILKDYLYKRNNNTGEIDICRWDYEKLHQIIDVIPTSEISDDILNMYNFIVSKIN